MKNIIAKVLIVLVCFSFFSCKEDFSPFGENREKYALFSILRNDTTFQVVMLGKSYGNGLLDPYENTEDHSVAGAEIKIWKGDSVYFFKDSVIDNSGQGSFLRFYFNDHFTYDYNEELEIEALLPNGRKLNASTVSPKEFSFKTSEVLVPPVSKNIVQINWDKNDEGTFFQPRLYFRYREEDNPAVKIKEIPVRYVKQGDSYLPVFPKASANLTILYELDAITRALTEISTGEQDKNKYSVYEKLVFEVAALDINLSRYISTTNKSFDDLTVRVNELDYTNVSGGFGIFGSYILQEYSLLFFQPDYVTDFGYNFINEE